ncbi:MAG: PDZ domain-containing protein [Oscillospiraceae bacterium]|nr:PDZ domain-containing protein [Oscillospiraceae bacterium]
MGRQWLLRLRTVAAIWIITTLLCGTAFADGMLIPVGEPVGIQIQMDGVLVAGTTEIQAGEETVSPAREAGIRAGDIIVSVNGQAVDSAAVLMAAVDGLGGNAAEVTVRRGEETATFTVTPAPADGGGRLGLWLRDGVAGIGTITYIDPETGAFGALGHGVNDVDTGVLLPVGEGAICRASILDVKPGLSGAPGELSGAFNGTDVLGRIGSNTVCGIFGAVTGELGQLREAVPIGTPEEIVSGPATILACVSGQTVEEYDVEISRTGMAAGNGRDLMVCVTDPDLLAQTGGIVQGMSGSPILQNGKLVGAVTHVCVNL